MIRKLFIKLFIATCLAYLVYGLFLKSEALPIAVQQLLDEQFDENFYGPYSSLFYTWLISYFLILAINLKKLWMLTNDAIYWSVTFLAISSLPDLITGDISAGSAVDSVLLNLASMSYAAALGAYLVEKYETRSER